MIEGWRQLIRVAAITHIHADDIAAGNPRARSDSLHVTGARRALQAMNQEHREMGGPLWLRLPVAVAQDAAAIRRVHLDGVFNRAKLEPRTGQKVAYDGLQMAVPQPPAGFKGRQTRKPGSAVATLQFRRFSGSRESGQ